MYCHGNPLNYADPSGFDRIFIGWYQGKGPNEKKFNEIKRILEAEGHQVDVISSPTDKIISQALEKYDFVFLSIHSDPKGNAGDQTLPGVRFSKDSLGKEIKGKHIEVKLIGFLGCHTNDAGWDKIRKGPYYVTAKGYYFNASAPTFINSFLNLYLGRDTKNKEAKGSIESSFAKSIKTPNLILSK